LVQHDQEMQRNDAAWLINNTDTRLRVGMSYEVMTVPTFLYKVKLGSKRTKIFKNFKHRKWSF